MGHVCVLQGPRGPKGDIGPAGVQGPAGVKVRIRPEQTQNGVADITNLYILYLRCAKRGKRVSQG